MEALRRVPAFVYLTMVVAVVYILYTKSALAAAWLHGLLGVVGVYVVYNSITSGLEEVGVNSSVAFCCGVSAFVPPVAYLFTKTPLSVLSFFMDAYAIIGFVFTLFALKKYVLTYWCLKNGRIF